MTPTFRELLTNVARRSNRGATHRAQLTPVGSFLALRFADPDGTLTVKEAQERAQAIGEAVAALGLVESFRPVAGPTWQADGVAFNWRLS